MMDAQDARKDWVLENFSEFEKGINGEAALPLHRKRKEALSRYSKAGFPTVRDEEWRYTNPQPLLEGGFRLLPARQPDTVDRQRLQKFETPNLKAHRIFIIDGYPLIDASIEHSGLSIQAVRNAKGSGAEFGSIVSSDEQFVAINTSFLQDGVIIRTSKNAVIAEPIELIWLCSEKSAGALVCPRVFIEAADGSRCTIIERFAALEGTKYLNNGVLEASVGNNAFIDHYRIQNEAPDAFHVSTVAFAAGADAQVRTHSFSFGAQLARNNVIISMNGSGSEITMNGLSALTDAQHVDNHTTLDHAKPHCNSHELYKGIYGDRSQGVFSGTIIVRPDAQKTNAIQSNRSLLLTGEAQVNSKPQLKIWADDVKCTHGATVGQLDEDALFYIRSRGTSEGEAKKMLIHAFASEVIGETLLNPLKDSLEDLLSKKIGV